MAKFESDCGSPMLSATSAENAHITFGIKGCPRSSRDRSLRPAFLTGLPLDALVDCIAGTSPKAVRSPRSDDGTPNGVESGLQFEHWRLSRDALFFALQSIERHWFAPPRRQIAA
ncbi:MAG TPA: hypothetical protein VN495_00865 [Candidatus Paceibacterota bacterium]|nr:hypothetical protein [Candidatus Paceibacterota bacterium]